jgi:hypothetical protein
MNQKKKVYENPKMQVICVLHSVNLLCGSDGDGADCSGIDNNETDTPVDL